jgi:hypothetical protein
MRDVLLPYGKEVPSHSCSTCEWCDGSSRGCSPVPSKSSECQHLQPLDLVETANSHDFPSSIDVRSKVFENLEDSLASGSIIAPLEPWLIPCWGGTSSPVCQRIKKAKSKDGAEQI